MDKRIVVFQVGTGLFGVEICQIQKIISKKEAILAADKKSPKNAHMLNWQECVVPVLNLYEQFQEQPLGAGGYYILLGEGQRMIAFAIDKVDKDYDVPPHCLFALPSVLHNPEVPYIQEVARIGKRLVMLLNMDFIFSFFAQTKFG